MAQNITHYSHQKTSSMTVTLSRPVSFTLPLEHNKFKSWLHQLESFA